MRKIIAVILCLIFALSLSGCTLVKKNVSWETIEVEVDDPDTAVDNSDSSSDTSSEMQTDSLDDASSDIDNDSSYDISSETKNDSSESKSSEEQRKPSENESTKEDSSSSNNVSTDNQNSSSNNLSSNEFEADTDTDSSTTVVIDESDKPSVEDPGALGSTVPEDYDSLYNSDAKAMRKKVLSAKDSLKATGTTYYISAKGNDDNNGTSKQTPWATLFKLNEMKDSLKPGDVVLLERSYVYRTVTAVDLVSGVSYGAYGTGDKPCVYGSAKNYAKCNWVDMGNNIWKMADVTIKANVGLIVFNHGKENGYRYDNESQLSKNYDFCSSEGMITLYLDEDPNGLFDSIEIGLNGRLFNMEAGSKDITIENICFKYTGGHAVRGANCSNITVRGLEIGYVGGSVLTGYGTGNVRYGNGIEFMSDSQNILVENNWIYQIYDSGVTHQGDGEYHLNGFTVRNNLIEYCGMGSIEYWHTAENDISNVLYEGNLLRFAGYGFGGTQRPDKEMTGHIMSNAKPTGYGSNKATNFVIKNNLFELSTYQLVNAASSAGTPPTLSGNTYVQWTGKWLGYYGDNTNTKFGSNVEDTLKTDWGDSEAIVEFVD